MSKIITCEQVSNGHPDKICDQIADAIVTDILQHDRNARVAIECLLKKSQLFIAGEVTTDYRPNYNQIVHDVFNRIGAEKLGWNRASPHRHSGGQAVPGYCNGCGQGRCR